MAIVRPFRALHYSGSRFPDLGRVLAPPYDIISPDEQAALYERDTHNVIRLEYAVSSSEDTAENNRYTRAHETLSRWLADGTLLQEKSPAFFLHRQRFADRDGNPTTRWGFFAAVELQRFGEGDVLPHEWTLRGPKEDRLQLMRTCGACFSPVLGVYEGRGTGISALLAEQAQREPDVTATGFGYDEALWRVTDPGTVAIIAGVLTDKKILIADGHHRYETLLALRDEMAAQALDAPAGAGFRYALMLLLDADDPGLLIYPTHRLLDFTPAMTDMLLTQAKARFTVDRETVKGVDDVANALAQHADAHAFVLYMEGKYTLLTAEKAKRDGVPLVDTQVLGEWLIAPALAADTDGTRSLEGNVRYTASLTEAVALIDAGAARLACLLKATPIGEVMALAEAGVRLPQKSTYFYPKAPTGLVMHRLSADNVVE